MHLAKRVCFGIQSLSLNATNKQAHRLLPSRSFATFAAPTRAQVRQQYAVVPRATPSFRRLESTVAASGTSSQPERKSWRAAPHRRPDEPVYELYFTCKVCKERSGHSVSKQAYHKGTVLVQCPGCKNRHLITDHLKIFSDKSITLEDIMRDKGEAMRKGGLDQQGEIEFWETSDALAAEQKPEHKGSA